MCVTFKKNNNRTKKPGNRVLQGGASAGIRSLQTAIVIKLCQTPGMDFSAHNCLMYLSIDLLRLTVFVK